MCLLYFLTCVGEASFIAYDMVGRIYSVYYRNE